MKVLAIGNSFSQDAMRYLHQIAKADGTELITANLFIGGCSLHRHYVCSLDNERLYNYEFNGYNVNLHVSLREALTSQEWDVVTLQQASYLSADYETYQPYLNHLAEYVRKYAPKAKIYIHQTWSYEDGSAALKNNKHDSSKAMFAAIEKSYTQAAKDINADGIIRCGEAMLLAESKGIKVHRDAQHAGLGIGRYLLALVWYKTLTGHSVLANNFADFAVEVDKEEVEITKQIAESIA